MMKQRVLSQSSEKLVLRRSHLTRGDAGQPVNSAACRAATLARNKLGGGEQLRGKIQAENFGLKLYITV